MTIQLFRYTGTSWPTPGNLLPAPTLWMEYAASTSAGTIVHNLIGGGVAVTHRPASPRRVRLRLFYPSETDARTCVSEHGKPGLFRITHVGRDTIAMTYAAIGEISLTLDPETAEVWIVELDAQEVLS